MVATRRSSGGKAAGAAAAAAAIEADRMPEPAASAAPPDSDQMSAGGGGKESVPPPSSWANLLLRLPHYLWKFWHFWTAKQFQVGTVSSCWLQSQSAESDFAENNTF